ncbi:MAG: hypothetical protein V1844_16655 [Pseudomonadota bacterium]
MEIITGLFQTMGLSVIDINVGMVKYGISDNQGLFLTPASMYSTYEKVFENALQTHSEEPVFDFLRVHQY